MVWLNFKVNAMTDKPNGYVLWRGRSQLDGAPIVAIATGLEKKSTNTKTGAMIQTWIIREDVEPTIAMKTGKDASICGDCQSRGGACYVLVFQAPLNVYRSFHRGLYPAVDSLEHIEELFAGHNVRLGSYGDPAAVPTKIWRAFTRKAQSRVGYTHQWRACDQSLSTLIMASVDSEDERSQANAKAWRTFRVKAQGAPSMQGEITCPASKEAGYRTTCENCGLCGGSDKRAKDIVIEAHGHGAKKHHAGIAA